MSVRPFFSYTPLAVEKLEHKGMDDMRVKFFKRSWFSTSRILSILLLGSVLLLTGCAGQKAASDATRLEPLTPITESPTNLYYPGKFVWHDLLTPDVDAAKEFYGELFGWSFQQEGRYTVARNKGQLVGGILEIDPEEGKVAEALWLASVSVTDVDKAAEYVVAQGGKVLKGPLEIENRGRGVLISDPQGAHLVLLRAIGGDPEDTEPAVNGWLWNEIWTNSPQETISFYNALRGSESLLEGDDYLVFVHEGKWRAGVRHVDKEEMRIRWVPTIRVEDPESITARVEGLGGVVWVRPGEPPSDGDTALIADNTGALLMVQRWPKEQPKVAEQ